MKTNSNPVVTQDSALRTQDFFSLIARLLIGGVLIYSGASKALVPSQEFAAVLASYKILPNEILPIVAQFWPWVELLVGTYIFFGFLTQMFAGVAAGMFAVFLIVLGSTFARGIDLTSCGCFGVGLTMSPQKTVAMDAILLVLAICLARVNLSRSPFSADSWISK